MAELSAREELELRRQRQGAGVPQAATQQVSRNNQPASGQGGARQSAPATAFSREFTGKLFNTALGIPDLAATALMSIPNRAMGDIRNLFRPEPTNMDEWAASRNGPLPEIGERVIPGIPDANTVFAGAQRLGEGAAALRTGNFNEFRPDARAQQKALTENYREQNPLASGLGSAAGDAAALLAGRGPLVSALARPQIRSIPELTNLPAGVMRTASRVLNSGGARSLAKAAGRSLETGLEGAALAILNEGDPVESAAYGAAAQMGGTAALGLSKSLLSGGVGSASLKLGAAAFAAGSAIQLFKSGTPGGENFLMQSLESGYDKVLLSLIVGATAGAAGAGRLRGTLLAEELPRFADALSAIPRGMLLSKMNEYLASDDANKGTIERVVNQIAADPGYFSPEATAKLERAMTREGVSMLNTINSLIETDGQFRTKFDNIGAGAERGLNQSLQGALDADESADARPVSATRSAERLNARLPNSSPLKSDFTKSGPRAFVAKVLADEQSASAALRSMGEVQKLGVLETNLTHLIFQSYSDANGTKTLDADRFQSAWSRLPESVKAAYPEDVQQTVDRFIGAIAGSREPIQIVPQRLAHSLMNPNSSLAARLGQTERKTR